MPASLAPHRPLLLAAAICGFSGVLIGAFGAHSLKDRLGEAGMLSVFETSVHYHLIHAVALLGVAIITGIPPAPPAAKAALIPAHSRQCTVAAGWAFVIGIILFSGSLYLLALTKPPQRWLGAITPFGGVSLLIGWALLCVAAIRTRADAD